MKGFFTIFMNASDYYFCPKGMERQETFSLDVRDFQNERGLILTIVLSFLKQDFFFLITDSESGFEYIPKPKKCVFYSLLLLGLFWGLVTHAIEAFV